MNAKRKPPHYQEQIGLREEEQLPEHLKIREQRAKLYGDFKVGHAHLAECWTHILEEYYQIKLPKAIPTHVACLMLVQLKVLRASRPFRYDPDDYVDARNYLDFANETQNLPAKAEITIEKEEEDDDDQASG